MYAYPVERGEKASPRRRSKNRFRSCAKGGAIGIFPQGTRVREGEGESKAGVALLANLAQAPVVPAYIWGTKDAVGCIR